MFELKNYDRWLEGAFDRHPSGNSPYNDREGDENVGFRVFVIEADDFGTIEDAGDWHDAEYDSEGCPQYYGGTSYTIKMDKRFPSGRGDYYTMGEHELEDRVQFVANTELECFTRPYAESFLERQHREKMEAGEDYSPNFVRIVTNPYPPRNYESMADWESATK